MTKKKTSATGTKPVAKSGTGGGAAGSVVITPEPPTAAQVQLEVWGRAVELFSQGKLLEARDRFLETAKGPAAHIADKARSYAQVCERRTAKAEPQQRTAEDHFNLGVERLNARDLSQAEFHLGKALALQPDADHVLYTMALCRGFSGDGTGAYENLKRAIELDQRNRVLARQDTDFTTLSAQFPSLRALLATSASGTF